MFFEQVKFDAMANRAKELLQGSEADSFCISSLIPERWLIEEEKEFDSGFKKAESVKSSINRKIAKELASSSKKTYSSDAQTRIVFDFNNFQVKISNENMFIFGRYEKYSRELSQSRWACQKCEGEGCFKCHYEGKNYVSIEELIGDVFKKHSLCTDYSLHASGREDVDVTNTAGRPFVIELKAPEKLKLDIGEIELEINSDSRLKIRGLRMTKRSFVETVSNSHFDKDYEAEIELSHQVDKEKMEVLGGASFELSQNTPKRVMHRRSDLERKRKVKHIELIEAKEKSLKIRVSAEPGTYIKELVSGDDGRTTPSISAMLGAGAKCTKLSVVKIHDEFLDLVLGYSFPT